MGTTPYRPRSPPRLALVEGQVPQLRQILDPERAVAGGHHTAARSPRSAFCTVGSAAPARVASSGWVIGQRMTAPRRRAPRTSW
ncbi:hypothetical protein NKH77_17295 [Streptomyces sp. M19]